MVAHVGLTGGKPMPSMPRSWGINLFAPPKDTLTLFPTITWKLIAASVNRMLRHQIRMQVGLD